MKLDGLFENEFDKLQLKKVRLKTDPKKPLLEYEGFILKENRKFLKLHEGILDTIGKSYKKLEAASERVKAIGKGNLGQLRSKPQYKNLKKIVRKRK